MTTPPEPASAERLDPDDAAALERRARRLGVAPVVLAGDHDVAPSPADLYPKPAHGDNAPLAPLSWAAFQRLRDQGWAAALRAVHPDGRPRTFWSYPRRRWPTPAWIVLDR